MGAFGAVPKRCSRLSGRGQVLARSLHVGRARDSEVHVKTQHLDQNRPAVLVVAVMVDVLSPGGRQHTAPDVRRVASGRAGVDADDRNAMRRRQNTGRRWALGGDERTESGHNHDGERQPIQEGDGSLRNGAPLAVWTRVKSLCVRTRHFGYSNVPRNTTKPTEK